MKTAILSKTHLPWLLLVVGVIALLPLVLPASTPDDTPGLPVRLLIPEIGVDAAIEHVGLTTDGAMDVPKDPAEAAWFKLGTRPGEVGSAVIAGHFGWTNGKPAVFDDISKLKEGDKLYVEDGEGTVSVFVVRELRIYDDRADAKDVFTSSDGKSHLNLVTCEGKWDAAQQNYSNRLVVFADKE